MTRLLRVALGLALGALLGTLPVLHYRSCAALDGAAPGGSHATHTH